MALGVTSVAAQGIKRNIIESHKVSEATFEVVQKIESEDTTYFVTIIYQNMKYTTIRDTEIIIFDNKADFIELVDAIKDLAEKDTSSTYEYTTKNKCWIFTSKYGVIMNSPDGKFTMFNRKVFLKKYESVKNMSRFL